MAKIKDIPKIDRPREKFLKKGPEAPPKSDLLAILLGSWIKGKNVQKLAQQIIKEFGKNFLMITIDDLQKISGIGQAKALQITSAISLIKRFYDDDQTNEVIIKNSQDVTSLTYDLRNKKKEHLVGDKYKLIKWIFSVMEKECEEKSFADIFAGTVVGKLKFNQIKV